MATASAYMSRPAMNKANEITTCENVMSEIVKAQLAKLIRLRRHLRFTSSITNYHYLIIESKNQDTNYVFLFPKQYIF